MLHDSALYKFMTDIDIDVHYHSTVHNANSLMMMMMMILVHLWKYRDGYPGLDRHKTILRSNEVSPDCFLQCCWYIKSRLTYKGAGILAICRLTWFKRTKVRQLKSNQKEQMTVCDLSLYIQVYIYWKYGSSRNRNINSAVNTHSKYNEGSVMRCDSGRERRRKRIDIFLVLMGMRGNFEGVTEGLYFWQKVQMHCILVKVTSLRQSRV